MYFIKALVGLGFPFGFRLSHSSLETPSSRAKCNQFFFPGVSSPASKIATFSKQSIFSSRVTIVSLSAKWESCTHQSINQSINWSISISFRELYTVASFTETNFLYIPRSSPVLEGSYNVSCLRKMMGNKNIFLYKIFKRVYLIICWEPLELCTIQYWLFTVIRLRTG